MAESTASGSRAHLAELQEHVTCPICLEVFQEPKELTCRHSLCNPCINKLLNGDFITCPTCRKVTNVTMIRHDFKTSALSDWYRRGQQMRLHTCELEVGPTCTTLCSTCQSVNAAVYCTNCELCLCAPCKQVHMSLKPGCTQKQITDLEIVRAQSVRILKQYFNKIDRQRTEFVDSLTHLVDKCNSAARLEAERLQESEHKIIKKVQKFFEEQRMKCDKNADSHIRSLVRQHLDRLEELQTLQEVIELTKRTDTRTLVRYTRLLSTSCNQAMEHLKQFSVRMSRRPLYTSELASFNDQPSCSKDITKSTMQSLFGLAAAIRKKVMHNLFSEDNYSLSTTEEKLLKASLEKTLSPAESTASFMSAVSSLSEEPGENTTPKSVMAVGRNSTCSSSAGSVVKEEEFIQAASELDDSDDCLACKGQYQELDESFLRVASSQQARTEHTAQADDSMLDSNHGNNYVQSEAERTTSIQDTSLESGSASTQSSVRDLAIASTHFTAGRSEIIVTRSGDMQTCIHIGEADAINLRQIAEVGDGMFLFLYTTGKIQKRSLSTDTKEVAEYKVLRGAVGMCEGSNDDIIVATETNLVQLTKSAVLQNTISRGTFKAITRTGDGSIATIKKKKSFKNHEMQLQILKYERGQYTLDIKSNFKIKNFDLDYCSCQELNGEIFVCSRSSAVILKIIQYGGLFSYTRITVPAIGDPLASVSPRLVGNSPDSTTHGYPYLLVLYTEQGQLYAMDTTGESWKEVQQEKSMKTIAATLTADDRLCLAQIKPHSDHVEDAKH